MEEQEGDDDWLKNISWEFDGDDIDINLDAPQHELEDMQDLPLGGSAGSSVARPVKTWMDTGKTYSDFLKTADSDPKPSKQRKKRKPREPSPIPIQRLVDKIPRATDVVFVKGGLPSHLYILQKGYIFPPVMMDRVKTETVHESRTYDIKRLLDVLYQGGFVPLNKRYQQMTTVEPLVLESVLAMVDTLHYIRSNVDGVADWLKDLLLSGDDYNPSVMTNSLSLIKKGLKESEKWDEKIRWLASGLGYCLYESAGEKGGLRFIKALGGKKNKDPRAYRGLFLPPGVSLPDEPFVHMLCAKALDPKKRWEKRGVEVVKLLQEGWVVRLPDAFTDFQDPRRYQNNPSSLVDTTHPVHGIMCTFLREIVFEITPSASTVPIETRLRQIRESDKLRQEIERGETEYNELLAEKMELLKPSMEAQKKAEEAGNIVRKTENEQVRAHRWIQNMERELAKQKVLATIRDKSLETLRHTYETKQKEFDEEVQRVQTRDAELEAKIVAMRTELLSMATRCEELSTGKVGGQDV